MKILTLDEVKKKNLYYKIFDNGDYSYIDDMDMEYLIRNNKLIATSSKWVESYSDGWYLYYSKKNGKDIDICHLMDESGNELLVAEYIDRDINKERTKEEFYVEDNHGYLSKEEVIKHYEERKKITFIKALTKKEIGDLEYEYIEFENGDYKYVDDKGVEYLIREGKTIAVGREIKSYPNGWYQYKIRRPGDNYDVDRLLNQNHHILAESKEIVVREDDYEIFDEEDLEKYTSSYF